MKNSQKMVWWTCSLVPKCIVASTNTLSGRCSNFWVSLGVACGHVWHGRDKIAAIESKGSKIYLEHLTWEFKGISTRSKTIHYNNYLHYRKTFRSPIIGEYCRWVGTVIDIHRWELHSQLMTCPLQPLCWYVYLYIQPVLEVVGFEVVDLDVGLADLVNEGVFVSDGDLVGTAVGILSLFPRYWNTRENFLKLMEPIPVAASHPFVALKPVPQHIVLVHVLSPLTISFAYKLAYLYKAGFWASLHLLF